MGCAFVTVPCGGVCAGVARQNAPSVSHPQLTTRCSARTSPRTAQVGKKRPYRSPLPRSKPESGRRRVHPKCSKDEFGEWSSEFTRLCDEQLELLHATVPNIATSAVFFRREDRNSGVLEFIPLATYPKDPRVWISSGASDVAIPVSPHVLPGGIPARWILPDYPFLGVEAQDGFVSSDGSLCVPIMFSNVVAGSLVLWRVSSVPATRAWSESDVNRVRIVARTVSLAAALEGRWLAASQKISKDAELLGSLGLLLRSTVHQIRSPVTALVTFGRLLLRRLPPGDKNRSIAKSIVVEGFRLDDLLKPLDHAGEKLSLPASELMEKTPKLTKVVPNKPREVKYDLEIEQLPLELFWVTDILEPIVQSSRALASARNLRFVVDLDEDAPPVLGHERSMREAIRNCVDNALKYTPRGGAVGIRAAVTEDDPDVVEVTIWDSGRGISAEEQDVIWNGGERGAVGMEMDDTGSGLGLAIAMDLVTRQGGRIVLESPIAPQLDGLLSGKDVDFVGDGTLFRISLRRPGR